MSTLKTTNIQNASSATTNIALDTSGNVTVGNNVTVGGGITASSGTVVMSSPYTMRNKIINGAMVIDQRNAGASVTPTANAYTVDRWVCGLAQASKLSFQQSTTAPTGYSNSLLCTSTSAYTVGAAEAFLIRQYIEGLNIADLAWGTASAITVTLSFWVRSSLTGTFGGSIKNSAADRSYPFSYTISSANTWEQKSVTITGDTTGTWLTTNGVGMGVGFSLGAGASASNTAGAWAAGNYSSATGATSVVGTNGATLYITGVQLERGTVATPFEYRNYQQELAMCQRYYYQINTPDAMIVGRCSTNSFVGAITIPVVPRTGPVATFNGSFSVNDGTGGFSISSFSFTGQIQVNQRVDATATGATAGRAAVITGGTNIQFSMEL